MGGLTRVLEIVVSGVDIVVDADCPLTTFSALLLEIRFNTPGHLAGATACRDTSKGRSMTITRS